ncbi:hypothetical protein ACQ4LE_001336 [Meloidogyne hapla]|uniref:General stress protein n=1 Tax=Meloidogyne hapla TaxID=6305 RepID=A0A1I8C022_MELHA
MTNKQIEQQIQNMDKLFKLQGKIGFLIKEVPEEFKDEAVCSTVSQTSGHHLNKLLKLKGMVDVFIREIPEDRYHTSYKNPVAVFDKGQVTLVKSFKEKQMEEAKKEATERRASEEKLEVDESEENEQMEE